MNKIIENIKCLFKHFWILLLIIVFVVIPVIILVYYYVTNFQSEINSFLVDNLRHLEDKEKNIYPAKFIMDITSPIFLILLGLFSLVLNTIIYFATNKNFNGGLRIAYILLFLFIIVLCAILWSEYKDICSYIEAVKKTSLTYIDVKYRIIDRFRKFCNWSTIATLVIYVVFAILDFIQHQQSVKSIKKVKDEISQTTDENEKKRKEVEKKKYKIEKELSFQQLIFIDCITIVGLIIMNYFIIFNIDTTPMTSDISTLIFVSGANGMQMIFSQIVFLILSFLFCYKLYEHNRRTRNNAAPA